MDDLFRKSDYFSTLKAVNLRLLLNTYLFLKPGASQQELAQRLNLGPMTVSRMLTKEYPIKDEWLPVMTDMLRELHELRIDEYAGELTQLSRQCGMVGMTEQNSVSSKLIYKLLLADISSDFEEIDVSQAGFRYFSWEQKTTWMFVNASWIMMDPVLHSQFFTDFPTELKKIVPKRTDNVTIIAVNDIEFDVAVRWYRLLDWKNPSIAYLKNQQHSVVLLDVEKGHILKNQKIDPIN